MNRLLLLLIFIMPFFINADTYNEALKFDAKGDSEAALELFNKFFDENINDVNQDGIIEKLIYSSTLLPTIDESMAYMLNYVKYMKNPNSRFRIYKKIGEIYELTGDIYNAGIYYEKAAYTMDDYIDYSSLLRSIEMLIELGFYDISIDKLNEVLSEIEDISLLDSTYMLLTRVYKTLGDYGAAVRYIERVETESAKREFYRHELGLTNSLGSLSSENFEKMLVYSPYQKLKTPADYMGKDPILTKDSGVKPMKDDEEEIYIGHYENKVDAAGIVNIANQMGLPWFFDKEADGYDLFLFSDKRSDSVAELNKLGVKVR